MTDEHATTAGLAHRARAGANWFYWIAGLSLVNSLAHAFGTSWGFIAGLGITQIIDALADEGGNALRVIGIGLDLLVAGVFITLGYLARSLPAPFIIGLVLYGLDALFFLAVGAWIGLAFHVFVFFSILAGYKAFRTLHEAPPHAAEAVAQSVPLAPAIVPGKVAQSAARCERCGTILPGEGPLCPTCQFAAGST